MACSSPRTGLHRPCLTVHHRLHHSDPQCTTAVSRGAPAVTTHAPTCTTSDPQRTTVRTAKN
ncbi:hypothetical protein NN4_88780 [Nocardia ninae NBRC 108245]|uniref:Uncharacterized protein n=1 Tax=Nocardia ninae NBRC 108245 TaxID=1210091 RepID=A0A511MUT9_9NOCA|nr:hypothetical protein NN4_88780 [Nocardia ninae NBRC 108245]